MSDCRFKYIVYIWSIRETPFYFKDVNRAMLRQFRNLIAPTVVNPMVL